MTGWPFGWKIGDQVCDVQELGIPVRRVGVFVSFLARLQRVPHCAKYLADCDVADQLSGDVERIADFDEAL